MASLLGSKFCLESLRSDVTDLQSSVVDVLSRCGPIDAPSWKYPDRRAADVDLTHLLELYDYSDDEEERQLSHVVLLELVIDRFVLLLQSLSKHNESLGGGKMGQGSSRSGSSHTSIGLVVKSYWNRMLHTHQAVQQLQTENKSMTKKMVDLDNQVKKLTEEVNILTETVTNMEAAARSMGSGQTPFPLNDKDAAVVRALTSASNYTISRDEYNKCTQTVETAFVPCESCECVQRNLRDVGDFTINVCTAQGLPSSLSKYKEQIDGLDWFTANDVARWSSEVGKDLTRINKHLDGLLSTIDPLEKNLAATKKQNKELEKKMVDVQNDMKLERETSSTERKQFLSKIDELKKETASKINSVEQEKELLDRGKQELSEQIDTMKDKLDEQKQLLQVLESEKKKLENDLSENQANHSQVRDLENKASILTSQLVEVKEQLQQADQELAREKARVKSMGKQNESVQGRQESLIGRLEQLSSESEEMREKLEDMEEEKYQLEEQLERAQEQRTQLEQKLKEEKNLVHQLESDKDNLEQSITDLRQEISDMEGTLRETQERVEFLTEYPDRNGAVNPEYQDTGDTVTDMNKQIHANSIRIQVLEEQNNKYRRTVTRMMDLQRGIGGMGSKPVALWTNTVPGSTSYQQSNAAYSENNPTEYEPPYHDHQYSAPEIPVSLPPKPPQKQQQPKQQPKKQHQQQQQHSYISRQQQQEQPSSQHIQMEFVVGKGPVPPKSRPSSAAKSSTKQRPTSGSRPGSTSSSVAAYAKLKSSGLMKNRPTSGKSSSGGNSFHCSTCNRGYDNPKDLEIHQMYCY